MYLKPRKPSTDPRLRSLLQKAVRRGFPAIVDRVVSRLCDSGDSTWLRSRTAVIAFEECWPLGGLLSLDRGRSIQRDVLAEVARSPKQKDAAGLGALAYAYREGDTSTLACVPDKRTLQIVAEALGRPNEFFQWVLNESESQSSIDVIRAAQRYLPTATWAWDKTCMLAGALLATAGVPLLPVTSPITGSTDFPYWTALDKHTDEGKVVLRDVARTMKVSYRQLIWASFYCESTRVNELRPSLWFAAERKWRLGRAKLTDEAAQGLWAEASILVRERLEDGARALRHLVESGPATTEPLHA